MKLLLRLKMLFLSNNEIFYINGNETLPPPLTKDEECKIMGATIKGSFINKNCKVYEGARIIGKNGNIVLNNNVSIGENCIITIPCEIEEAQKIVAGTVLTEETKK